LASASTIFLPFGPGSSVLISGLRGGAITPVDIAFLLVKKRRLRSKIRRLKTEVFQTLSNRWVNKTGRLVSEEIRARLKRAVV
jgi:hypothetical protein